VIDEGQDFSPAMLRSLAAAIPSDGSLMFFGDVAQQIYGSRISWRSAGLSAHKIWRFEQNYRNSKQIAQLGLAIAQMPYFQGETDMVAPREPRADGPRPTLVKCSNEESEFTLAFEQAIGIHRTQSVAILMRNRSREADFIAKFHAAGVSVRKLNRYMPGWSTHLGVFTGTYHAAKGLEFDTVILPFCNASVLPDSSRAAVLGSSEDAMSEEGRLLYVAITRAKTNLILTYSGELTPLLPRNVNLYERVIRK
jgi:superfamily I DNA/RNA helicase